MFANKTHLEAYDLMLNGRYEEAIPLLDAALSETPAHADLFADRAFCYFHINHVAMCLKDLDQATDLQPKYAFRYSCRGYVHQLTGASDAARKDYEKALNLDPEDPIARYNLQILLHPSVKSLKNPEEFRKRIAITYLQFQKAFPTSEQQKKLLHFLKNGAKNQ